MRLANSLEQGTRKRKVVTLNFTSWNQIAGWLKRLHALKAAA